ncbi:hypothetical protein FQZ97_774660 [compost metagenome]
MVAGFGGFVAEFLLDALGAFADALELLARDQRLHGVGALVVPVAVEAAREVLHDRAGRQHVDVDEVAGDGIAEVGVAQVAPARHAHHVVGQEQLVVHALLDARDLADGVEHAVEAGAARTRERVEQPHLDVRDEGQAEHQRVAADGVEVVQQDAHPHAALGRRAQPAHQPAGAGVGVDGVVLQVQRLLCVLDQRQPAAVGRLRAAQQQEAGIEARLVGVAALPQQRGQRRAVGRGERGRDGAVHLLRQLRAGAEHQEGQQRDAAADQCVEGRRRHAAGSFRGLGKAVPHV